MLCGDGGRGVDDDDDDENKDIPSSLKEYWRERCKLVDRLDSHFCRMYVCIYTLYLLSHIKPSYKIKPQVHTRKSSTYCDKG